MTATTHEFSPLYASAGTCGHIEPPEPEFPEDDMGQWASWAADHPTVIEEDGIPRGQRFCLDTEVGKFCPDCTEWAREYRDLPDGEFIHADACWTSVTA